MYTTVVRPALAYGGRDKCTGEVTRLETGGCRNENATMDVRSYKVGQDRNLKVSLITLTNRAYSVNNML